MMIGLVVVAVITAIVLIIIGIMVILSDKYPAFGFLLFTLGILCVSLCSETISAEKAEVRAKNDGIETVSLGKHEYRIDSKRNIVFCDDEQVYSSKTGKPMTAEEFNSTLPTGKSKTVTKTIKLSTLFWTPDHNDGSWFIDDKSITGITHTWGEDYNVGFSDGTTGHYGGDTTCFKTEADMD